ncbi:MAG: hypothetical protein ACR2QV_12120 [Gammaproteobacteria bacterium]
MQPFTVVLGIVFGSLFSIAFSLAVVLLVFWILRDDHPRFDAETPELFRATLIFGGLAVLGGLSFLGTVRKHLARYAALSALWAGLFAAGWYYWPA